MSASFAKLWACKAHEGVAEVREHWYQQRHEVWSPTRVALPRVDSALTMEHTWRHMIEAAQQEKQVALARNYFYDYVKQKCIAHNDLLKQCDKKHDQLHNQ